GPSFFAAASGQSDHREQQKSCEQSVAHGLSWIPLMVDDGPRARIVFRLYLIADRRSAPSVRAALAVLPPASAAVQLRDKDAGGAKLARLCRALLPACHERGAK